MLKNYFITAWRSIKKNKGFFVLNFIGLYISVVVCLLMGLIILYETSSDKSVNDNISIYRIIQSKNPATRKTYKPVTQYPPATTLRAAPPDEKMISQIHFPRKNAISFNILCRPSVNDHCM
jgi:putative ABC transport system permease protein